MLLHIITGITCYCILSSNGNTIIEFLSALSLHSRLFVILPSHPTLSSLPLTPPSHRSITPLPLFPPSHPFLSPLPLTPPSPPLSTTQLNIVYNTPPSLLPQGCGFDPYDTGCCIVANNYAKCYRCDADKQKFNGATFFCQGTPTLFENPTIGG